MSEGGEAQKNQANWGACGKRRAAPRAPNPKLNGSFQKPKPKVPDGQSVEVRALRLSLTGGDQGNARRANVR